MRTVRSATIPVLTALVLAGTAACSVRTSTDASPAASSAGAGSTTAAGSPTAVTAMLSRHGLAGKDVRAIIDELDRTDADREAGLMGSVRQDTLVLKDAQGEVSLPMPTDATYVSIAPFTSKTHDCFFHSLATCQGEMVKTPVTVKVTDATGKVIADESVTTYDNGFVGLWLPRNVSGQVSITAGSRSATAPLATGADDPTCVTTIKLT